MLWFVDLVHDGDSGRLVSMTTEGVVHEVAAFDLYHTPRSIVADPDGRLWVARRDGVVERIDTDGTISEKLVAGVSGGPSRIAVGRDGAVWVTEPNRALIARIGTQ